MPLRQAIERSQGWHRRLTVPQFTAVTGLLVILLGTLLLATPLCSSSKVGLWEALFTATSAITVTGLSIIDIGSDLTTFGQLVLALMILAGGLGLMAITTFLQGFVVKGTGLRRRLDLQAARAGQAGYVLLRGRRHTGGDLRRDLQPLRYLGSPRRLRM